MKREHEEDIIDFSLDSIIAEVKSQTTKGLTEERAESQDEDSFFRTVPDKEGEETPETVLFQPIRSGNAVKVAPGFRGKWQQEEEEEEQQQEEVCEDSQERPNRQAQPAETPPEADTREFAFKKAEKDKPAEEETETAEKNTVGTDTYDFLNRPYDDAAKGAARLTKLQGSIATRLLFILPFLILSVYMSICLPLGWPMPFGFTYLRHPYLYLLVLAILQVIPMILAYDVTAAGLWRLTRGRPTADTLVLFSSLCSLLHIISIIIKPQWGGYLPFSCVSVFTCFFALAAKRQRAEGLKRTYKACLQGTVPTAVKIYHEDDISFAVKASIGAYVDTAEFARRDTTESFSEIYAPLAMVVSIALAFAASFGQQRPQNFFWCLAAISAVAAPPCLLISSSLPTRRLIRWLYSSGSSLINSQRSMQLSKCSGVILRDSDIFPVSAVELMGLKIAQDQKLEQVVGCAAAMLADVGGGIAKVFADFAREHDVSPRQADSIRYYETGGMSADIGSSYVLLGGHDFMSRMGIRVSGSEAKRIRGVAVFMAIDGRFAGIFSLKYIAQPQPYQAFHVLNRSKVLPFLGVKDFNLDQTYIEGRFDLRAESTEYPELLDRLRLSDSTLGEQTDTLAFLPRDGMLPLAEVVAAAKKLRRAVCFNLTLSLLSSCAGLFLMYFLASNFKVASATPGSVLLYLGLWLLASILGSGVITKY